MEAQALAVSSSWVDLLSDSSHTSLASMSKRKGTVRVTESTPGQSLKRKEQTIQGLMAHICSLREEFKALASNFQSPSPHTTGLLEDLERLTYKNADLCNALAAIQYSRNCLEREVILLKRTLLEERSRVAVLTPVQSPIPEIKELLIENERLKRKLDRQQKENKELKSLALSQTPTLKLYEEDITRLNHEIERLRQSQLTEIDQRCNEVDALKQQLSGQLSSLQRDRDSLSHKLIDIAAEKNCLVNKVSQLEGKANSLVSLNRRLEDNIQQVKCAYAEANDQLLSAQNESESVKRSSEEKLADLRAEVQRQLSNCLKLKNDMELKLDQRAYRIQDLENALHKHTQNLSAVEEVNSIHKSINPTPDLVTPKKYSLVEGDILSLNQRLVKSRQVTVFLEAELAQLKTDNAKLSGFYEAMLSIRDRLSEDNAHFRCSNRELQCDNETLLREKAVLLCEVDKMSTSTHVLASDLSALKNELYQLSGLCKKRETELVEYRAQKLLDKGGNLRVELDYLHSIVETEIHRFNFLVCDCKDHMECHQQEMSDLVEKIRICGTVNSTRYGQIEVCDESIFQLQGELEVLHARKAVILEQQHSYVITTKYPSKYKRLKQKLKLQKKKTNYLRIKLGYVLSELRLHKQLKGACDQQLCELQGCLIQVQAQYQQCAAQLEAAGQQLNEGQHLQLT